MRGVGLLRRRVGHWIMDVKCTLGRAMYEDEEEGMGGISIGRRFGKLTISGKCMIDTMRLGCSLIDRDDYMRGKTSGAKLGDAQIPDECSQRTARRLKVPEKYVKMKTLQRSCSEKHGPAMLRHICYTIKPSSNCLITYVCQADREHV
jgi:hypothetical protein